MPTTDTDRLHPLQHLKAQERWGGAFKENRGNAEFFNAIIDCTDDLYSQVAILNSVLKSVAPDVYQQACEIQKAQRSLDSIASALGKLRLNHALKASQIEPIRVQLTTVSLDINCLSETYNDIEELTAQLEALAYQFASIDISLRVSNTLKADNPGHFKSKSLTTIFQSVFELVSENIQTIAPENKEGLVDALAKGVQAQLQSRQKLCGILASEVSLRSQSNFKSSLETVFANYQMGIEPVAVDFN